MRLSQVSRCLHAHFQVRVRITLPTRKHPTDRPTHQQAEITATPSDRPAKSGLFRRSCRRAQCASKSLAVDAGHAGLEVPHRRLQASVRVTLSTRKHPAVIWPGLVEPVAFDLIRRGVARAPTNRLIDLLIEQPTSIPTYTIRLTDRTTDRLIDRLQTLSTNQGITKALSTSQQTD